MKSRWMQLLGAFAVCGVLSITGCSNGDEEPAAPAPLTEVDPVVARSQLDSHLKNAATAMETFATSSSSYEGADLAALEAAGYQPDPTVSISVTSESDRYCIEAAHTQAGITHLYDSQIGSPQEGTC